jgi:hypothetical protein
MTTHLIIALFLFAAPQDDAGDAKDDSGLPPIAEKIADLERHDGLLTLYVDEREGRIWLELAPPHADGEVARLLYVEGLRTGLGSNPVGLDRGQLGNERVIRVRRIGPKVLMEQVNTRFRALTPDSDERRAVKESFATSVVWGGKISALDDDGRALVDITSFVVRDAHRTAARLKSADQGDFTLDESRSAADLSEVLVFPDNAEFEAILTFTSKKPGPHVRETAPTATSVTLVQHHSLIRLPEGYTPRRFDPRTASYATSFIDYAAPLDEPMVKKWIARHRLEKVDPDAPESPVKEPIVYYVDRGAPEPIRSALIDGAGWWAEAFERAGFIDAYRVELMPEGAHPLDVRYNVIQWVHRSTRGWSYGGSVSDPRTGEIIKGHVTLGSLRVRQDRLLFEGLAGVAATGSGRSDDPVELSLARLRQLSAHEVGHTLGFSHNFAASTYGGRASVMDYPAPLIKATAAGTLDFSNAYDVGIGEWDIHAVRYAYEEVPPGEDESRFLEEIIAQGMDQGLLFITDHDARPLGSAHPRAHLWDNGADAATALAETMAVRRIALDNFGLDNIDRGRPLSLLQEVFMPVYFHHRYQLEAAVKLVGGVDYLYSVRGDGQGGTRSIAHEWQRRALDEVLACLDPAVLRVPGSVEPILAPRPFGHPSNREVLAGETGPAFDTLGVSAIGADLVVSGLLHPDRCARLVAQQRRDPTALGLDQVLQALTDAVLASPVEDDQVLAEIRRRTRDVVVERMIALVEDDRVSPAVRGIVESHMRSAFRELGTRNVEDPAELAHRTWLILRIGQHVQRQVTGERSRPRVDDPPPGSPIGMPHGWFGCACDGP